MLRGTVNKNFSKLHLSRKNAPGTCKSTANCSKATVNKAGLKTVKIWGCTSCVDFKKHMVAYDASVDVECKECDTRADLCNKDL